MDVGCWIQQVTTRIGAVICWIQQPVSPKQVVGFSCLLNSEVDQLISKVIVDGLMVTHTGETGEEMYGGVVSSQPIDRCSEGRYFEVQVEATRADKIDGLAIGVTACPPEKIEQDADILAPRQQRSRDQTHVPNVFRTNMLRTCSERTSFGAE